MVIMGLMSRLFAALCFTGAAISNACSLSSIEHISIIVFAFGMGGTLLICRLLHMTPLADEVAIFTVGTSRKVKGTQHCRHGRSHYQSSSAGGWCWASWRLRACLHSVSS